MSLNRYAYAGANPVNIVDPSGMIYEGPLPYSSCGIRGQRYDNCEECVESIIQFLGSSVPSFLRRPIAVATCATEYGVCGTVQPTSGPTPTSTPFPTFPTNTPLPENVWRLPMDNAALTNEGCLARRVVSTYVPCSRDVNPRYQEVRSGYPVYAPNSNGVVWYSGEGGTGLGNVVILKYDVSNLPHHVQNMLPQSPQDASLFIQYAHLDSDNVGSGDQIPEGLQVGLSGSSGTAIPHLDISVIWIPNSAAQKALASNFESASNPQQWDILTTNGDAYNARWTIDPLRLWDTISWEENTPGVDVPPDICQAAENCKIYTK